MDSISSAEMICVGGKRRFTLRLGNCAIEPACPAFGLPRAPPLLRRGSAEGWSGVSVISAAP